MLFSPVGTSRLQRIQGAFIDESRDRAALTDELAQAGRAGVPRGAARGGRGAAVEEGGGEDGFDPDEDPLLADAIRLVAEMQTASTSMLQRRLRLGYTRAGRLIDMLERRGVISGYEGSKPRQVLISEGDVPRRAARRSASSPSAVPDERTARLSSLLPAHARDRRDAARGADAPADRHDRGRERDQDPRRSTCARWRTRSGTCSRVPPSSRRSCAPTPSTSAWTRGCWWRSTASATSGRRRRT